MQKECTEIRKRFHESMFSSVKMSWAKENEALVESVAFVKNSCISFAKRQAAHTVHVTWIVVGLRTTGLCNRTMTSPSSFCTCLWSTPWAGGLISIKEKRKVRQREKGREEGVAKWNAAHSLSQSLHSSSQQSLLHHHSGTGKEQLNRPIGFQQRSVLVITTSFEKEQLHLH